MISGADRWAWERSPRASPCVADAVWLPADNHHKGTEGTGGNTGAKHSDKAKQTGPGYHFWQASKAHHPPRQPLFQKTLLVGSWSQPQRGPLASLCPHPSRATEHGRGGQGALKSGCRQRGVSGVETEGQSWAARGSRTEAGDDDTHTPGHFIGVSVLGARSQGHRAGSLLRAWG